MKRLSRAVLVLGTPAIVFGLGKYHAAVIGGYDFTGSARFAWAIGFALVLMIAMYGFGLPDIGRFGAGVVRGVMAAIAAAIAVSSVQLALGTALLPRFVVFGTALLTPLLAGGSAWFAGLHHRQRANRDRVLAVVGGNDAATLTSDLAGRLERPASLVGTMTVDEAKGLGGHLTLAEQAVATGASIVVLDRCAMADDLIVSQAAALHESGVRVRSLAAFYEEWVGKIPIAELERSTLMFDIGDVHETAYQRLARVFDIVLGLLGCSVMVALIPVVVVGNLIGNRGSLFYSQPRVGKGRKEFRILKFRSMRAGDAAEWTAEGDQRITPFGRVLRLSHLDELPQVLNILRGELSVVGPRPEQPHYVEELAEKIPFYHVRHLVRPGLTGWAQVNYRYGSSEFDALEKLQYEIFYLRHQSFWLDLKIVARTLQSVLGLKGR